MNTPEYTPNKDDDGWETIEGDIKVFPYDKITYNTTQEQHTDNVKDGYIRIYAVYDTEGNYIVGKTGMKFHDFFVYNYNLHKQGKKT